MQLEATLTKENFWDEIAEKYPKAMKDFGEWIDKYKEAVNWNALFADNKNSMQQHSSKYKFHEIPYAMQYGIWMEYVRQNLDRYFEQPEHVADTIDLREDIKSVFSEIEDLVE